MTSRDVWVRVCDDDQSATYAFRCPSCQLVVIKPAEAKVVDLLVASGVPFSTWRMPAELQEVHQGEPISHDDLLDFHRLLSDDSWMTRLLGDPR